MLTPGIRNTLEGRVFESTLVAKSLPRTVLEAVLGHAANKVVFESYKVVDRDFEALNDAGYSDDAIVDITLAAAAGAAMARLQKGLAALGREV